MKSGNLRDIGKRLLLDGLASAPYTGGLAREWDSIENNKRFEKIERRISEILEAIGKDPERRLESAILKVLNLMETAKLLSVHQLRKAESCMILLREINQRSESGKANDPFIAYDECMKIAKGFRVEDPEDELRLVLYELERQDLVYRHESATAQSGYSSISPKEYFFCRTDSIFQKWNPEDDAVGVIRFLVGESEQSIVSKTLDIQFKWGARRLNSVIAYLHLHGLIHADSRLGGIDYVLDSFRLTEEARFFLNNHTQ